MRPGGYDQWHVVTIGFACVLAGVGIIYGKGQDVMPVVTAIIAGVFGLAHSNRGG